jgi:hydrogenase nickel incorporation protein HypA/HybF
MHEISVCRGLMAEVERIAAAHGAASVRRIAVAVGPLSGVEAVLLERAFAVVRNGTVAGGATLEVERIPVVVWCETCREEHPVPINRMLCGRCGGSAVQLRRGAELLLKQIELETAEAEPVPAGAAPPVPQPSQPPPAAGH